MRATATNIFQQLMRYWEGAHPYNAAQVIEVIGDFNSPQTIDIWTSAWYQTMRSTGLDQLQYEVNSYDSSAVDSPDDRDEMCQLAIPWQEHVSIELNRPFNDLMDVPLRPFIGHAGPGRLAVGLVYRHWIADSTSIRMLMREWFVAVFAPDAALGKPFIFANTGYWNTVGPGRSGNGIVESILSTIRRQTRLRRAKKIDSRALNDRFTRFVAIDSPPNLLPVVRSYARRQHVTVNDVLLSALAATCWEYVPLQARPSRREIAVGSIVDLRKQCPIELASSFGLFLGFMTVIAQPHELADFDRLVTVIAAQSRNQKGCGIASGTLMWLVAATVMRRFSSIDKLYHVYRKDLPLAGGISNVDLNRTWAAEFYPAPLLRYVRISPTGPMTPLVVTATSLGDRIELGLTHRTGLISVECADAIGAGFVNRLAKLSG